MSTTPLQPPTPQQRAQNEAIALLCARHLHQVLWLPESPSHGRLRVTFSTTKNFSNTSLPVALLCGPMFGSRYHALILDHLCAAAGVRLICVDRPGMGGSTAVPLNVRLPVWLETATALLRKLDVDAVDLLLSHSAGTLYAMHTLYHLRSILCAEAPFVAFVSPWVHNSRSSALVMSVASKVPDPLIDSWNSVARFFTQRVAPTASWSSGVFTAVGSLLQGQSAAGSESNNGAVELAENYGTSEETALQIQKMQLKYYFAEDTTAGNEDAKLCLRKQGVGWGFPDSYDEYVTELDRREAERRAGDPARPKLKVRVYFAESDIMIGKIGEEYFDGAWEKNKGEGVDYGSVQMAGTDHDSAILDLKKGAMRRIFDELKRVDGR